MKETTIMPLSIGVTPAPEEGEEGPPYIELIITEGSLLPFPGPDGGPIPLPTGNIRVPITRDIGLQIATRLGEEAEKLPKESKVVQASSMSEADRLAALEAKLKP